MKKMNGKGFQIDFSEQFEHLDNAPIVEAVIHWRARAEKKLEPADLLQQLKANLPDYPEVQPQHAIAFEAKLGEQQPAVHQQSSWQGFRFESADKRHVAQFTRNGFVFSRLSPYPDWKTFQAEAQRLWRIYCEFAEPSEVQRLGVRFINRIAPVALDEISELLTLPPSSPPEFPLPLAGFLHQNTFEVPGHPYQLKVTQTIQPTPQKLESFGLILDIDVGTTRPMQFEEIENRLPQLQWIKNKAFFSLLKNDSLSRFQE